MMANLFQLNPGFELGDATGWETSASSVDAEAGGHSGSYRGTWTIPSGGGHGEAELFMKLGNGVEAPVEEGILYRASVWIRGSAVNEFSVYAFWFDAVGDLVAQDLVAGPVSVNEMAWQEYAKRLTAPADAAWLCLRITIEVSGAFSQEILVDDAEVITVASIIGIQSIQGIQSITL